MLAVNADSGPLISHIPFLLNEEGTEARLHLVRSNPILRLLDDPQPAVIVLQGPHGYISPDWYGVEDQVPTWNYIAVHLRGRLERLPDKELGGILDDLSAHFEQQLAPKPAWTSGKMTPDALKKMMRMIVPCRMLVEVVEGTWKLNQNKDDAVRHRAADAVSTSSVGSDLAELVDWMHNPPS